MIALSFHTLPLWNAGLGVGTTIIMGWTDTNAERCDGVIMRGYGIYRAGWSFGGEGGKQLQRSGASTSKPHQSPHAAEVQKGVATRTSFLSVFQKYFLNCAEFN